MYTNACRAAPVVAVVRPTTMVITMTRSEMTMAKNKYRIRMSLSLSTDERLTRSCVRPVAQLPSAFTLTHSPNTYR